MTHTKDEALRLALEALENCTTWHLTRQQFDKNETAITVIKQALAAPVQEPVAILKGIDEYGPIVDWHRHWVTAPIGTKFYTALPAAQPAPVQPIIGSYLEKDNSQFKFSDYESDGVHHNKPAVPDAFGTREGEHPQYIQGWNDCRAEMLKGMK